MIQIESVLIEEFRGIRKLTLDFQKKNFAICGPNGTGKSGVVDAIEFALTGDISRLTGEGTEGITVKSHAPHVDRRNAPQKARVVLKAFLPETKKSFTLERSVSSPKAPRLTPSDTDITNAVTTLSSHPEFALTRREIIKYILATPNNRAKAVQALLRLEELEKVRTSLYSISNATAREATTCKASLDEAGRLLRQALGIPDLRKSSVLEAVNKKRAILSLEPLAELEATTSLKEGVTAPGIVRPRIVKHQALSDLSGLCSLLENPAPPLVLEHLGQVKQVFETLRSSPSLLQSLKREGFLKSGMGLIGPDGCPFCDAEWEQDLLREHIQQKLNDAKQASSLRGKLMMAAQPVEEHYKDVEARLVSVLSHAEGITPKLSSIAIRQFLADLRERRPSLSSLEDIELSIRNTATTTGERPRDVDLELKALTQAVTQLPDVSAEESARDQLLLCQDRLETYRRAGRSSERAAQNAGQAAMALDCFSKSVTEVLDSIYAAVETDFSSFYKVIHHEDEDEFVGKLSPSLGKLGFDVDFYGRGFFPPGAYHSEGHQDSMGVCLYLALMRHTLKERFTFAVLDDVLMSVDAGHRREVCALLKQHFPDTQFVITTHDDIWLQHMRTERILSSKAFVHFKRWSVEDGPVVWEGDEIWAELEKELANQGVATASGTLRRYLEYLFSQLANKLQAPVPYRGDARWDLGELLPAVVGRFRTILGKAADSAQSWQNSGNTLLIASRKTKVGEALARTEAERWPINATIHYNEWANMQEHEFRPVLAAFKELLVQFRCSTCENYLYLLPQRGSSPEEIRCDCGQVNFNLKRKP